MNKEQFKSSQFDGSQVSFLNNKLIVSGVYKIVRDSKVYVGSSKHIIRRWKDHIKLSKRASYIKTMKLNNALKKHDISSFIFSVLEETPINLMREREQFWIDALDSYKLGFNATSSSIGTRDFVWTLEDKEKISKINRAQAKEIKKLRTQGISNKELSTRFNLHRTTITRICKGETWEGIKGGTLNGQQLKLISENKLNSKDGIKLLEKLKKSKFSIDQIDEIRREHSQGITIKELSRKHKVLPETIGNLVAGRTFSELPMYESSSRCTSRRPIEKKRLIKNQILDGVSPENIKERFGVSRSLYYGIKKGAIWKNV